MRFLFLSLILASCTYSPLAAQKVVIDVNGQQLRAGEFAKELAFRLKDQDALSARDIKLIDQVKSRISQEFIVQSLTSQWAQQNSLLVKAEELESEIQKIKSNYPDDLAFQQTLTQEGVSFKDWREKIQATLLEKMVLQKITEKMPEPTEGEIKAHFDSHREQFVIREAAQIRQILLSSEGDAKTIEVELKKGKRLSDLAKKYSISPEGKMGGDLGWMEKGNSDVIFDPAIKMAVGQRSQIVKSPYGYHIYEKTGHRAGRFKQLNEVKSEIRGILVEKKQRELYFSWLDEQVRKARIFKDQDLIASLKVEMKLK